MSLTKQSLTHNVKSDFKYLLFSQEMQLKDEMQVKQLLIITEQI